MLKAQEKTGLLLITTPFMEGYDITDYLGLVIGKSVFGANFMKDFFAGITDKVGGRSRSYESVVENSIEDAIYEMAVQAKKMGANAVIGITISTNSVGGKMFMANCAGTAVKVK